MSAEEKEESGLTDEEKKILSEREQAAFDFGRFVTRVVIENYQRKKREERLKKVNEVRLEEPPDPEEKKP